MSHHSVAIRQHSFTSRHHSITRVLESSSTGKQFLRSHNQLSGVAEKLTFPWVPVVRVSSAVGTQIAQQGGPIAALVLCPTVANVAKVSSGRVLVLISQPSEAVPDLSTQFSAFSTRRHGLAGGVGTLVRAVGGRKAELHQIVPTAACALD